MKKNCIICKKDFNKKKNISLKNWNTAKYCSFVCYWKSKLNKSTWNKGKKLSEEHKNNLKGKRPNASGDKHHFFGKHHSESSKEKLRLSKSGSKSNLWKGGISKLTALIRGCFKTRQWRSDVFTRDSYTCQECGIKSGCGHTVVFQAHHIKSQAKIIQENNIRTLEDAINCDELWNLNNGITLCIECHKKTDSYASKGRILS